MTTAKSKVDRDRTDRLRTRTPIISIGQLARQTRESIKAIRYWTDLGLLACMRRPSGCRTYPARGTLKVRFIHSAQAVFFSLDALHQILAVRQAGGRHGPFVDPSGGSLDRWRAVWDQLQAQFESVVRALQEGRTLPDRYEDSPAVTTQ